MVALAPDGPAAARAAVDGTRAANSEALQPTAECLRSIRFDDEVEVVGLDGEMEQTERAVARGGERLAQFLENRGGAERRNSTSSTERGMNGKAHVVLGSTRMRGAGSAAARPAAGAGTTAAQVRGAGSSSCRGRRAILIRQ